MERQHQYKLTITWTGNTGNGTANYKGYERRHMIMAPGKKPIEASSDADFRGDAALYNPEELLVASLASCHMLWFLHLCSENGVIVEKYTDNPTGMMIESSDGSGYFTEVTLYPMITLREQPMSILDDLHHKANKLCFIANSCKFPVHHKPEYTVI